MTRMVAMLMGLLIGLTAFAFDLVGGRPSFAQKRPQCAPTTIDNLDGDILFGARGEQYLQIRACAPGDVLLFEERLPLALQRPVGLDTGQGHTGILLIRPCDFPSGSDLPGTKLTVSFISPNQAANASRTFILAPDTEKPTLAVKSRPREGSKVGSQQEIKVRMTASEQYANGRIGWQTGVKKIQLRDEISNRDVPPSLEEAAPAPCAKKSWERQLDVTYRVPSNPPPVIRLRACAWDHAKNEDCKTAEFPTGDWYGSIEFSEQLGNGRHWGRYDITLEYDGQGNLKGRMAGTRHWDKQTTPSQLSAKLVGQYTPGQNAMSLQIVDPEQSAGKFAGGHPWGGGLLWVEPLQRHFRNLPVANDGSVKSTAEVWGERWTLTLQRAQR
jgi:hypothetical protein